MVARLNLVVVEDNDFLRDTIVELLRNVGHTATGFYCAEEMDEKIGVTIPDIYVLDINLPGENGFEISKRIRQGNPKAGIVMFSARTKIEDRVHGYQQGADIYLPKPVDPEEFLSAISALGRRIKPDDETGIRINLDLLTLEGPKATVHVSQTEAMLLSQFATAQGQFLEYWVIVDHFFGADDMNRSSLDARISYLRKKLVEVGVPSPAIQAVRKQGYRLLSPIMIAS